MCKYCHKDAEFIYDYEELCYDCLVNRFMRDGIIQNYEGYYYIGDICIGNGYEPFNFNEVINYYNNLKYIENQDYGVFEI